MIDNLGPRVSVVNAFREARRKAALQLFLARLRGQSIDLLSFEEVRRSLKTGGRSHKGLREIPLDAIVGSVDRYTEFTRNFLPKRDSSQERWTRVKMAALDMEGLPPISAYKIGDVYFIEDGHHRVSVAKELESTHVMAYITEISTKVPLSPDVEPKDIIVKAEYAEFLEKTQLDKIRPELDLTVTAPGKYAVMEEHISVHQYFLGIDEKREISYPEAVAHWADTIYLPTIEIIRSLGLLHEFPDRTYTDLYLWLLEYHAEIEQALGWQVERASVAENLTIEHSPKRERVVSRIGSRLLGIDEPDPPAPSHWRQQRLTDAHGDRMFVYTLVPVGEKIDPGWYAMAQAVEVAKLEKGFIRGLLVVNDESEIESQETEAAREMFANHCAQANIDGQLAVEIGSIGRTISRRARWNDLVVVNLFQTPGEQPIARLRSEFHTMLLRTPRPILAVLHPSKIKRAMVAYDGSQKATEGLYLGAYMAAHWGVQLSVLSVDEGRRDQRANLVYAQTYLNDIRVEADYIFREGKVADEIIAGAEDLDSDLIIMGGLGHRVVFDIVIGSAVEQVLARGRRSLLISR